MVEGLEAEQSNVVGGGFLWTLNGDGGDEADCAFGTNEELL